MLDKALVASVSLAALVVAFMGGMVIMQGRASEPSVAGVAVQQSKLDRQRLEEISRLQKLLSETETKLAELELENQNYESEQEDLQGSINELRTELSELQTLARESEREYPFVVPSTGVVGSENGTFGGWMYTMRHLGIDIWTSAANGGRIASHKGNPVYSACDGKVVNIGTANGGVTIQCDEISSEFDVPEKNVFTHYAHLGHAETKELWINVERNKRVAQGELIGYQGDLSSFFPEMRNVHLHFSVFTGSSETDPSGGAIDPCLYIGGNCKTKGQNFIAKN